MPRGGAGRSTQRNDAEAGPSGSAGPAFEQVHKHTFLQYMMRKGWATQQEAKDVVQRLTGASSGSLDSTYAALLAEANGDLDPLDLTVKQTRFLNDGQWYVGFVNKVPDNQSKLATHFSHSQLAYFRNLLEALALTPEDAGKPSISSTDALHVDCTPASGTQATQQAAADGGDGGTQAPKLQLSKRDKAALLEQLLADGWISSTPGEAGRYSLGVRTFLELGHYLLEMGNLPESNKTEWLKVL